MFSLSLTIDSILFKNHLAHIENTTEPQMTATAVKIYASKPLPNRWTTGTAYKTQK